MKSVLTSGRCHASHKSASGTMPLAIAFWTLLFIGVSCADIASDSPIDVAMQASGSIFFERLNRAQAAGLLGKAIQDGQQKVVLLRYLGVDPRILSDISPEKIRLKFEKFDGFSRDPVSWSWEGSQMKTFDSPWSAVQTLSAKKVTERQIGQPLEYLLLSLTSSLNEQSTLLPLDLQPAGYEPGDVFAACMVLMGATAASDDTSTLVPQPRTLPLVTATQIPPESSPTQVASPAETPLPHAATEPDRETVAAPSDQPSAAPSQSDEEDTVRDRLRKLKMLYEEGLLDSEVYKDKQREILQQL